MEVGNHGGSLRAKYCETQFAFFLRERGAGIAESVETADSSA